VDVIFFGWGRKNVSRQVSPTQALVLSYGYFHLFWLFRVAFGFRYALASATEQGWATRPLSAEEVAETGADREVTVGWWWRWGLLIGLGALAAVIAVSVLTSSLTRSY
jgi:hypothetical protein